jgi:hypothetical protein
MMVRAAVWDSYQPTSTLLGGGGVIALGVSRQEGLGASCKSHSKEALQTLAEQMQEADQLLLL